MNEDLIKRLRDFAGNPMLANAYANAMLEAADALTAQPQPEWPCYCDEKGVGQPSVTCGDCPRDYGHRVAQPAQGGEPPPPRLATLVAAQLQSYVDDPDFNDGDGEKTTLCNAITLLTNPPFSKPQLAQGGGAVDEDADFETWWKHHCRRTWVQAECHKDLGLEPTEEWSALFKPHAREGWMARACAAPQPQRRLTDEEVRDVCAETMSYDPYVIARAVEAKLMGGK